MSNTQPNMKDFNLEKAKAGHQIVYRNGEVPKEWHPFNDSIVTIRQNGCSIQHYNDGRIRNDGNVNMYDLLLKIEHVTLWFVLWKDKRTGRVFATSYMTEKDRDESIKNFLIPDIDFIKTFEKTFEI